MSFYEEHNTNKASFIKFLQIADALRGREIKMIRILTKKSNIFAKVPRSLSLGAERHHDILDWACRCCRLLFYKLQIFHHFCCFISSFFKCSEKYFADGVFSVSIDIDIQLIRSSPSLQLYHRLNSFSP